MGMLFLRYQEYYESINPDFKGKYFKIFDYMKWYIEYYKQDSFTYPSDFIGYNIPSSIIASAMPYAVDRNDYDEEMLNIYLKISLDKSSHFYLIAGADKDTYNHELAHGLYYVNNEYKKTMDKLIAKLPKGIKHGLFRKLKKMYAVEVIQDEIQSYMATGLTDSLESIKGIEDHRQEFIKVFNSYSKRNRSKKANKS